MGRAVCVDVRKVVRLYSEVLSLSDHVTLASAIPCSTCAVYPRSCQYFSHFVRKHPNTSGFSGSQKAVFQRWVAVCFGSGWPGGTLACLAWSPYLSLESLDVHSYSVPHTSSYLSALRVRLSYSLLCMHIYYIYVCV